MSSEKERNSLRDNKFSISSEHEAHFRINAKRELRKRMRSLRNLHSSSVCLEKSTKIASHLRSWLSTLEPSQCAHSALFWPMQKHHEVDLRELFYELCEQKKALFFPKVQVSSEPKAAPARLSFHRVTSENDLEESSFGIMEPSFFCAESSNLDLVIVPALALTLQGDRLGYGKGFYDMALTRLKEVNPHLLTVGVAYQFQLLAELPTTETDVSLDFICTENGFFPSQLD